MNVSVRHLPQAVLITVEGEVDATSSAELEAVIDRARRSLEDHLVFDVSRLSFLDSSGLAALLTAATLARAHGAGVHLAGLLPRAARILEITGAWRLMARYDHVEQALAALTTLDPHNRPAMGAADPSPGPRPEVSSRS